MKINNKYYILILIIFSIITHIQWFNPSSILNHSDWWFWYTETISDLYIGYGTWLNYMEFGTINIQLFFNFFKFFWYLFGTFGYSYDIATKFTFLIPIALGSFLTPYIFSNKLFKDNFVAFVSALFYGTTTYFLIRQTSHIPIAFIYMLSPIFILTFISTLKNNRFLDWIFFTILNFVMMVYELRILFILYWVIFIYWVVFFEKKYIKFVYIKKYIFFIVSTFLLNVYWFLPTIVGSISSIASTAKRGLFGDPLFNILRSLTISDSPWTGSYPDHNFLPQSISPYLFFVPVVILIGFILLDNHKQYKRNFIYFGIISCFGIILSSQSSQPFPSLYKWLYVNFPGFSLYREASKFYLLTALGYLGLLNISLILIRDFLQKTKFINLYYFLCLLLISIFIYNTKPLITGEIGTMFVSKNIQTDYISFKNIIVSEKSNYRTFWTPTYSRYAYFNIKNGIVSNVTYINKVQEILKIQQGLSIEQKLVEIFKKDISANLFDNSNIKYIAVPIRDIANDDNFFIYYGEQSNPKIRNWYINELDKIDWLDKKDFGFDELVVYENTDYKDRIYLTQEPETVTKNIEDIKVEFNQVTPSEYKVKINNLNNLFYLNFVESYDSNWKLRIGEFNWIPVLYDNNYFLNDFTHSKSEIGFNSFELSPEYIKNNFSKEFYKENPDGSIDIELTLYFKPQSYFYLGLLISSTTLILCTLLLIFNTVFYKKTKNNNLC